MAIVVAEIATCANDLCAPARQDELLQRWHWWARAAKGVGPQTAAAFGAIGLGDRYGGCSSSVAC